jgi:hypothetical protein
LKTAGFQGLYSNCSYLKNKTQVFSARIVKYTKPPAKNMKGIKNLGIIVLILITGIDIAMKFTYASSTKTTSTYEGPAPKVFQQFTDNVQVNVRGDYVVLKTDALPNHKSPYWGIKSSKYETPKKGMHVNPHRINSHDFTFKIPLNPAPQKKLRQTPMGPIGIAINGVALYNQFAGGGGPLTHEIGSFDQYNGHPDPRDNYHYHVEPLFLTHNDNKLVGFLLDGFPLYGRKDMDNSYPNDLDKANGHFGVTADYPEGTYHYHIINEPPYICGGFKGKPGYVTR